MKMKVLAQKLYDAKMKEKILLLLFYALLLLLSMKKEIAVICFLFAAPFLCFAQTEETFTVAKQTAKDTTAKLVYTFVEQNPEFMGGDAELIKYIQKNLQYPQMERDNNIQGKVLLRFVILEDGTPSDIKIIRPVSPGLDKEAIRLVKNLPKFVPGRQQGKPVRVYFNLPIVFKL